MVVRVLWLAVALMVVGCQTRSGVRETPTWPYPVPPRAPAEAPAPTTPVEPPARIGAPQPLPESSLPSGGGASAQQQQQWPRSSREVSGAAVISLLDQADTSRSQGRPEDAAASLERAVRIEPRNAFVWSELAAIYIDIGNYEQAEAIAQRANSLGRGNPYLEMGNWQVIAAARSGRNDALGSLQARARAEELQAGLPRDQ